MFSQNGSSHHELELFQEKRHVTASQLLNMAVFWVVASCNLVEFYQRFRGTCYLMMEAASTSETSVNFYQTTRRYNPEDSDLHTRRRENLKFYKRSFLWHSYKNVSC
jgi:hypothetical protein